MDPSISFSFSPDFTDPAFGYVQTVTDTAGQEIFRGENGQKLDRFRGNPFGGTSSAESRRMNIAVNNLFQGKVIQNGDEKKVDLFNLNLNTAHNFLADSLKWSDIRSSLRAKASKDFDFTLSATHSLYQLAENGQTKIDKFVWENGFGLPRLVRFQLNARLHLAPPQPKQEGTAGADTTALPDTLTTPMIGTDPITEGLKKFKLPWDLTTNFSYSVDRSNINEVRKILTANVAARLEITKNWRIQYTTQLDLLNNQINYQSFNIYRDLHCWEMSFSWGPNPQGYSFFTLEIHLKEPVLRDIKLTKSSGGRRVF
jgi:hypothetical protein